jgi:hypothetical protein
VRKFLVTGAASVALTAAALGMAASASADAADAVVQNLQDQGYIVQINGGNTAVSLSRCTATGIHPTNLDPSASLQERQHTLVMVDVQCPHS